MLKTEKSNLKTETDDSYSTLLHVATEKSKSAVKSDSGVYDKDTLKLYTEAVDALQQVLEDTPNLKNDKSRLKSIQNGYLKRIEFLSSLKNTNMKSTKSPNNRHSLIRTPSSVKNILTTTTANTKSAAAVVALSSVFSKNKRLSNYSVRPDEEVKQLPQSRKSSFFNIKPSKSTPTMDKQKSKRESTTTNKKNILNRYSSDFSRLGNILLSRNLAVIGDTPPVVTPSSSTLLSFDNLYSDVQEINDFKDSEIPYFDSSIEPKSRPSTDSSSISTVTSSTPTNQEQNSALSNSGSTVDDDSEELPVLEALWETQVIEENPVDIPFNKKMDFSSFAARAISKTPSIVSQEITQPLQKSSSTSSFQSLLRRSKSTKRKDRLSSSTENSNNSSKTSSFVNYIQQTTIKNNRKVMPSDLSRAKTKRKWSLHISTGSNGNKIPMSELDPTIFLEEPFLPTPSNPLPVESTNETIALMNKLLESMVHGGCVTSKLYIPMDLWYQTNVRLPATDAKIAACELLLVALERMHERDNFNDCTGIETDLKILEQTLLQIKYTLIKKLGFNISDDNHSLHQMQSSSRYSSYIGSLIGGSSGVKTSQNVSTWSSKLTKSVERMKLEASKAIPNTDQNAEYIKALIRLFNMTKVLDKWSTELISMVESEKCKKPILYERANNTNERCISLFKMTVCQFVLKDYEILLDKWLKRSMDWMME